MPYTPNAPPADVQSPTQLIMAYLTSKGLPPTPQNISRALQMNAQNPGMIPGLTNEAPPPPDAPASTSSQAPGNAGAGLPQQMQQAMPVPPIPPQQQVAQPQQPPAPQQQAPSGGGGGNSLMGIIQSILAGGGAAGLSALHPSGMQLGMAQPSPGMSGAPQAQLPPPQLQLGGPQSPVPQGQPQIGGPGQQPQLPAPGERPAIPMPNQASGPTIALPTSGLSGMGEPLPARPPMPEMGSGINWSKVLGELPALLKGAGR